MFSSLRNLKVAFVAGVILIIICPLLGMIMGGYLTKDIITNMDSIIDRETMIIENCIISFRYVGCIFTLLSGLMIFRCSPAKTPDSYKVLEDNSKNASNQG